MQAQYNASELITRRPEVSAAITHELLKRAKDFYLDIIDVSIVCRSTTQNTHMWKRTRTHTLSLA